jgi:putative tricarboxylic transport membrane protein
MLSFHMRILDRVLGIFLMLSSLFLYAYTYTFDYPKGSGYMVDIAFFPRFLAVVLFILGLLLLLKRPAIVEEGASITKGKKLIAMYLSFIFYTLALDKLGFLVDTFLWVFFMSWLVGERKVWIILLTAFLATAIGYYLFSVILGVPLSEGRLLNLLGLL